MRVHEFAEKLGVSVKTLQRWDKSGKLVAKRTPTNQRYYTPDDLLVAKGVQEKSHKRKTIVYCRVSSKKQAQELQNQLDAMKSFCFLHDLIVDEFISEKLIFNAIDGRVETIVIAHKDRLCRFGYDLVEALVNRSGCKIIVANQNNLSVHQELVEDLLAIVHCFSCRIYGSRTYAKEKTQQVSQIIDIDGQTVLDLRKSVQC
jgi:putative resolvase